LSAVPRKSALSAALSRRRLRATSHTRLKARADFSQSFCPSTFEKLELKGKKNVQPIPKPVISKPTRPWKGYRKNNPSQNRFENENTRLARDINKSLVWRWWRP
jgi:hypothetical protein